MPLAKRLAALVVALALVAGNAAVCEGWTASPQSRMACCSHGHCANALSQSHPGGDHGATQSEADRCCAASESTGSGQTVSTFILLPAAILLPPAHVEPSSSTSPDAWRVLAPTPPLRVARHLLLTVFLV
jgi:hypothetical protein